MNANIIDNSEDTKKYQALIHAILRGVSRRNNNIVYLLFGGQAKTAFYNGCTMVNCLSYFIIR